MKTNPTSKIIAGTRRKFGWRGWFLLLALGAFVALNMVAFMQTWTMTHYTTGNIKTVKPEDLSLLDKIGAVLFGVHVPRPENVSTPADVGLSYETVSVSVGYGDRTLEGWYVADERSNPRGIVLMFPGYATAKDVLLQQAVVVHEMGWPVFMVDFSGAGGSSGSDTTLGVREAGDITAVISYVRRERPDWPVVVYGVSMGASAALRAYARDGARPDALILESPFDSLLNTVSNRFDAIGLPAFPSAELMVFWGSVQHGFNGFAHNPADDAASVQCPTLLMYGERDPRVTAEQSMSIFNHLNPEGGKSALAFPGAEHESLLANNKDLWVESVDRFLRDLPSN